MCKTSTVVVATVVVIVFVFLQWLLQHVLFLWWVSYQPLCPEEFYFYSCLLGKKQTDILVLFKYSSLK